MQKPKRMSRLIYHFQWGENCWWIEGKDNCRYCQWLMLGPVHRKMDNLDYWAFQIIIWRMAIILAPIKPQRKNE